MFMSDINSLKDECILEYATTLPQYRREKIKNYKFLKDKNLSVLTWALLRYSLSAFGCRNFEDKIAFGDYGKPFLKEPQNIYFNLSHSQAVAFCVVSNAEIGCDVEYQTPIEWEVIAKTFFCKSEYDYLISSGGVDDFFRIWTLKESFTKLLGSGLFIPLNSFEIKVDCESISVNYPLDKRTYHLYYRSMNGYHFACSSLTAFDDKTIIREVDACDLI